MRCTEKRCVKTVHPSVLDGQPVNPQAVGGVAGG